ncbi:MAG: hypothetical protein R3280_05635 [Marinobacter sp.]|uniref:hypothetical protein n=1 Tax=Marinobacter sp. TaxID=50741 RepID=UPI00299F00D5|nr:hypothetical protein [Marinobacter sp.]MDX1634094.1 hypothetical protein [Marinobacter sp.]
MQYADSVQQVLIRKINRAEQDLVQLKLDYCRFIYGLTHRSQVEVNGEVYQVRSVDVDTMVRREDGSLEKPELAGSPVGADASAEVEPLGRDWTLIGEQGTSQA